MELLNVRGEDTLELLGQVLTIKEKDFARYAETQEREDELEYYKSISDSLLSHSLFADTTTRQSLIQNSECISLIHFLKGRGQRNRMEVYMRSSDVARLPSDLSYLAKVAIAYGIHEIRITFGSLHIKL